jgi:hypothetical protein
MVPQPQRRDDWPPPVVLKYAGVKSWSAFERGLRVWDLKENDGIFQIAGNTRVSHGWVEDNYVSIWHISRSRYRSHGRYLARRGPEIIRACCFLIAGLGPAIHAAVIAGMTFTLNFSMDARVKPGHD